MQYFKMTLCGLAALSFAACSGETSETGESTETEAGNASESAEAVPEQGNALSAEEQYTRAIDCASSLNGMSNVWRILADIQEENAADYTARSEDRAELATLFGRRGAELGAEQGKTEQEIRDDMEAADSAVGARMSELGMEEGSVALGRDADTCANNSAAILEG